MNDDNPKMTSLADLARGKAEKASRDYHNTIEEIKENYGLLLELRDRKIKQLEEKLAKAVQKKAKPRLLVVDDAESTIEIMHWYLQGHAVEVIRVAGHQALDHLCSEDYDAIMIEATSFIEPNVDGLALCRKLCEEGKGESVIVMSSRPGEKIKNFVEEVGAAFLRKPFKREQLVKLVQETRATMQRVEANVNALRTAQRRMRPDNGG